MSNYGIISTVEPPVLKDVKQSSLIKFEIEYSQYKEKIKEINRTRPESSVIEPASIRQCVDAVLLNTVCILGEIEDATSLEEATDEKVQKWFNECSQVAPVSMMERVNAALNNITFTPDKNDASGAVRCFVIDVVSELDKNNVSEIVQDKETCKFLISKVIAKLEPIELLERIKDARNLWTAEQKSNISFFRTKACALAVEVNQGEIARARISRIDKKRNRNTSSSERGTKSRKSTRREVLPKRNSTAENFKKSKWILPCINPDCKEFHPFKLCKNTPDEKKAEMWETWKAKKEATAINLRAKSLTTNQKDASTEVYNGRYDIVIEGTTNTVALGDYGSDDSALPASLFQQVLKNSPSLPIEILSPPATISVAIYNGDSKARDIFSSSKKTRLSIIIMLPGSSLPLRIHGVPFYIVDQEMDEILLGRRFLHQIGFNLKDHLVRVASALNGKDFDHVNSEEVKISSAKYFGMRYNAIEDDPITIPEGVGANIGKDDPSELLSALENIVQEAKTNGITDTGAIQLTHMLHDFKDVFRINLNPDPPAKVAPLRIKVKENGGPRRSPQRRYAPMQRVFIANTIRQLEQVGAVYKNPTAKWASPALAVQKPGSEQLRFTVDLRAPNAQTEPIASAMPHLDSMLYAAERSTRFAKIDMAHAYWQLPLASDSQELLSIQTPLGVYSSNRLLQGSTDAGNYFQAVTQEAFHPLSQNLIQWLDDFLVHAVNEKDILQALQPFFAICKEYGFKIHAKKSHLFLKEANFCGRIISKTE